MVINKATNKSRSVVDVLNDVTTETVRVMVIVSIASIMFGIFLDSSGKYYWSLQNAVDQASLAGGEADTLEEAERQMADAFTDVQVGARLHPLAH